ncbi:MAG TPA: galactose oxidase-like domain-containing protein [Mycobacterium sp.]
MPLSFTASGATITATSPADSNIAPAGYYMLFVTDTAGVPSVAKIIRLERGSINPPPSTGTPIIGIDGRCLDIQEAPL